MRFLTRTFVGAMIVTGTAVIPQAHAGAAPAHAHVVEASVDTPDIAAWPDVYGAKYETDEYLATEAYLTTQAYLTSEYDLQSYLWALWSSRPQARPSTGGGSYVSPHSTTGACTGFSIPDYIIQRESGGNPSAVNASSGAYGCAQTLPGHYQPGGSCAGLDMYSIDGQRQCVQILSNGGTNLQPWSETR